MESGAVIFDIGDVADKVYEHFSSFKSYHVTAFSILTMSPLSPFIQVYFIERGAVEVLAASASLHQDNITINTTNTTTAMSGSNSDHGGVGPDGSTALVPRLSMGTSVPPSRLPRVNKISAGGIFGEAAFFLDLPQSVRCVALQSTTTTTTAAVRCVALQSTTTTAALSSCGRDGGGNSGNVASSSSAVVLWTLDRASYLTMETRHPQLCLLIQHALLKVTKP